MKRKEKEIIFLITTWGCGHFLWSVRAGRVPQGELVKPTHLQIGSLGVKKVSAFFKVTQSPRPKIRMIFGYANILFFLKNLPTIFSIHL